MDVIVSLKENRDFRRLYARGRSFVSASLVTYVMKNKKGVNRVGITTSKKIGNAVLRSRSRRVIREAYRQAFPRLKTGYDFVFVARGKTPHLKSGQVYRAMAAQLREAGVLE